ncbi:unnamed protein product [Linum trigynum]|uniref:Uncharacterized protein n=1 Tax=Linum trigynum TaxID=586398 RepID=A0AAV2D0E7_9ROSI
MVAPPKRGNHGMAAAIQLSSEIWSIVDGPPRMAPPPMMMMMNSAAAERERGSTMSPVKREARKKNSYGSPRSRRVERQGPYLAGRERSSPLSRE